VGGSALQNYNSRWRRPQSWIFAQTAITQPPTDVDEFMLRHLYLATENRLNVKANTLVRAYTF